MNSAFTILIAILAAIVGVLPSTGTPGTIYNKSYKGIKKLRPKGRWMVVLGLLGGTLVVVQNHINEENNNKKERANKVSFDSSLVAMDSSNKAAMKSIILAQAEALGKYGYEFDSLKRRLVSIENISKSSIDKPILFVRKFSLVKSDSTEYLVNTKFVSLDASTTINDFKYYTVVEDSLNNLVYVTKKYISKGEKIARNTTMGYSYKFSYIPGNSPLVTAYLYVKGNYKREGDDYLSQIDVVYFYNIATGVEGILMEADRKRIIRFIQNRKES